IVLKHIDLSMQNIFVHSHGPTGIVGIIDWEGTRTILMWAMIAHFLWPYFAPTAEQHHFT
ncbi:uncharacterized protein EV420DRAFT_1275653, partial [Desarmillaria tabescens]